MHKPVLVEEVILGLALKPGQVVLDLTAGSGGHAVRLLEHVGIQGRLILIDRDPEAIKRCQERLRDKGGGVEIRQASFSEAGNVLSQLKIDKVHGILMDLGLSREQLESPMRGFSFMREGPLDMRMDPGLPVTAADCVRSFAEEKLAEIFWSYGEERFARRIAKAICKARDHFPLRTTQELAELISKTVPRRGRIHPATRVFQVLRICVNNELEELEQALPGAIERLFPAGRLAVITYHSLEDRIVKKVFKREREVGRIVWVNKKPITSSREEIKVNPSARSAKLRVVERLP